MADIATAVEAVKDVAEVAAPIVEPAVNAGTLDWKKVALAAGGVLVLAGGTYICVRAIKKRKAKKVVLESATPVVDPTLDEVSE